MRLDEAGVILVFCVKELRFDPEINSSQELLKGLTQGMTSCVLRKDKAGGYSKR